ncbi:MAG: DinB family protein [Cyclobacteriaceae bacterium]|nr:DinB family protein [Cyclobacteriaceae bacterium]
MKEYFLKLYRYNAWANSRVLGALAQQKVTDDKILTLMSHVMAAQLLWLHRILGLPAPDVELWKKYSLERLQQLSEEGSSRWLEFIEDQDDFNRQLRYHNYVGHSFENNIEHIMIHTVNHATYHRGQVALLMRERGYEPVNTDFITYDRVMTGQLKN